jgi:2-phospho-L-lactate guanylyltransferase
MPGGTYAVIPVKSFASAKRRLAPILNSAERGRLARLMLLDVLDAVQAAGALDGFVLVTCDAEAQGVAEACGGRVIREAREFGLGQAVETALSQLAGTASCAVVIPADIPHLAPETIDAVVGKTEEKGVVLVPAIYDGGTNLLSLRPCRLVPALFGPDSFHRHHRAALGAGAATRIHICPKAGYDLDRPRDLETFLSFGTRTRAHRYLAGLGIGERIAALADARVPADVVRATA